MRILPSRWLKHSPFASTDSSRTRICIEHLVNILREYRNAIKPAGVASGCPRNL
jgi:hypothetical protein